MERQLGKTKKAKATASDQLSNSLLSNIENLDPYDWFTSMCGCAAAIPSMEQQTPDDDWSTRPIKGSDTLALAPIEQWSHDPTPSYYRPAESSTRASGSLVIQRQLMTMAY